MGLTSITRRSGHDRRTGGAPNPQNLPAVVHDVTEAAGSIAQHQHHPIVGRRQALKGWAGCSLQLATALPDLRGSGCRACCRSSCQGSQC